jgi:ankyrin repeat protein
MPSLLPPHANFEQLRRQARDLQQAHARGDVDARRRVDDVPELRSLGGPLTLAASQLAIARAYGFPSWAKLKHHLERAAEELPQRAVSFIDAACRGDASQARQILAEWPEIAEATLHAACAAGDVAAVRRLIERRPQAVNERAGRKEQTPLQCLCWSSLLAGGGRSADAIAIARELLARGADANATFTESDQGPPWTETVLAGACGTHQDAALMRALLDGGARADDGNSFFGAIGQRAMDCLQALVERGLPLAGLGLQHQVDFENPEMLRWLLEHGGDVNAGAPQETALHWAIKRGRSREVIALLLDHDADIEARIARGSTKFPTVVASTPLELAIRCLHRDAIELLLAKGARVEALGAADRVLMACARGDASAARSALAEDAEALRGHPELCEPALVNAAAGGNAAGIDLLLACGCPLGGKGWMEGAPLHQAALNGELEAVAALLRHGASVHDRENHHRTTPLSWAEYGSQQPMNPRGRYPEVIELLIAAGSPLPDQLRGSVAVQAVLRRHGVGG